MPRFRCYNCSTSQAKMTFKEFEADYGICPSCKAAEPAVVELTDVHLLIRDDKGGIEGQFGLRYRVGCEPKREVLAAAEDDRYSATNDVRAVTCPACKLLPEWVAGAKLVREMRRLLADRERGK